MKEVEFNLLEEPWIRVLLPDCDVREVSLTDALLHAQDYSDLAGELPTQDVAVLRLLLAILHAVFVRVDAQGREAPLYFRDGAPCPSTDEALVRWQSLWRLGRFPETPIREYLARWRERFWLFHPQRPFWQVPEAEIGTEYTSAKLNGELSESGNKLRLFPAYTGVGKSEMDYAQAARWLLHINGYDDTAVKPKGEGLPSVKVGYLGSLGMIRVQGDNLFETLMLNLTLLQDGKSLWGAPRPCWELDVPRSAERTQIPLPDNPSELLTLQSRRLLLHRKGSRVTGYTLLGGDFFDQTNAFCEQMTTWRAIKGKKNETTIYEPKIHDPSRQFWREFPTVFEQKENTRPPGIVRWISQLQNPSLLCLDRTFVVHFGIVGIVYDKTSSHVIKEVFSDELSFHAALLDDLGKRWRQIVSGEIDRCQALADAVGYLANDLALAAGNKAKALPQEAKEQFYFQIDQPFRQWLYSIDPEWEEEAEQESLCAWQHQAQRIARALGAQMAEQAGPAAFAGRSMDKAGKKGKKGDQEKVFYSTPTAYNRFLSKVRAIYSAGGGA